MTNQEIEISYALGLSGWIEVVTLIVAVIGLIGIFYQIREAKVAQSREFALQKISATFSFYDDSRHQIHENHQKVVAAVGGENAKGRSARLTPLTDQSVKFLMSSDSDALRQSVIESLYALERLAVGVKMNIFDREAIYEISRTTMASYLGFYARYIAAVREKTPSAYEEFESLASYLHARSVAEGKNTSIAFNEAVRQELISSATFKIKVPKATA